MNPPRISRGFLPALIGRVVALLAGASVLGTVSLEMRAATITWTGKGGNKTWSDPANWDAGNLPGTADAVVVPPRSGIVEFRGGNHSVLSITAPDGLLLAAGFLTVTEGESRIGGVFTVAEGATLTARGLKTLVIATGSAADWAGDLLADAGAEIRIPVLTRVRSPGCTWRALGAGSLIDARGVSAVTLINSAYFDLTAQREGRILFSGLKEARGPIRITATEDALVDVSALSGRWSSAGFSYSQSLTATRGGRILLPGVTEFDRGNIDIDSSEALPARQLLVLTDSNLTLRHVSGAFGAVTNINDSNLNVFGGSVLRLPGVARLRSTGATWRVQDPESLIDASALKEMSMTGNGYLDINVATDGQVNLGNLAVPQGPLRVSATSGGVVDLPGIKGRWTSEGFAYRQSLTASKGGLIRIPGLVEYDSGNLELDSADAIPTRQIRSFTRGSLSLHNAEPAFDSLSDLNDSNLVLTDGAVLRLPALQRMRTAGQSWRLADSGTVLDARALTELTFASNGYFDLDVAGTARANLSGLGSLRGPLRVSARTGGIANFSSLRGRWTSDGFSYSQWLRSSTGGSILVPGLTEFDRGSLDLDAPNAITTAALQSLTRATLYVRGGRADFTSLSNLDDTDIWAFEGAILDFSQVRRLHAANQGWNVRDPGTLIEASNLAGIDFPSAAYFALDASTGGRINLRGLVTIPGPLRANATTGGIIDLSGARGRWSSEDFSYRQSLSVSGEGAILVPGITEFDQGQITVGTGGLIPTAGWLQLTDSIVLIDGGTLSFARLRDQTGTTFTVRNGGQTVFTSTLRIIEPPADIRARLGSAITLAIDVAGVGDLRYQWRRNGQNLPGANSPTLNIKSVAPEDAGSYTVVVRNDQEAVESEPAIITMDVPNLPFADAFALRGRITTLAGTGTADSTTATLEPGEPRHASKRGGRSVWLAWQPPESGRATLTTAGSSFDTLLAVYVGNSLGTLTEVASDEDSGGFLAGRVSFNAKAKTEFLIAVDGFGGTGGPLVLSWDFEQGAFPMPQITDEPQGGTVTEGDSITLSVGVEGGPFEYQWNFKGAPIPGANGATLSLPAIRRDQAGIYSVRVAIPGGAAVETPPALVEVVSAPAAAPAQDKLDDLFPDTPRSLALHAPGSAGFTPVFPGIPGSRDTGNNGAQRSPDDPIILGEIGGASLWLRFQATTNGWMFLSTEGSAIPTVLGVYTNRTDLQEVALAQPEPPRLHSEVLFGAFSGEDYLVMIDGVNGAQGAIRLSYSLALAPAGGPRISFPGQDLLVQQPVAPGLYEISVGQDLPVFTPLLTTNVVGGMLQFIEPGARGGPRRFYRIQGIPAP